MSKHLDPKNWAREWVQRFWNQRDPRAMEELMHPDCTFTEMAGGSWETKGYEALRKNADLFRETIDGLRGDFVQVIGDDSMFAWAAHFHGTIRGSVLGAELIGSPFNMVSLASGRIHDSRIVQAYNYVSFNQPKVLLPGWQRASLRHPPKGRVGHLQTGEILRRYAASVWGGSEDGAWEEFLAPGVVITEANAWDYETQGIEALRKNSNWFRQQMPSPEFTVSQVISEPAAGAVMFELNGRVAGDAFGRVAQGGMATIRGMVIGTVSGDRLVHAYSHLDFNHIGMELPAP